MTRMTQDEAVTSPRADLRAALQTSVSSITGDLFRPAVIEAMTDAMLIVVTDWLTAQARDIDETFPPDEDGLTYLVEELNTPEPS